MTVTESDIRADLRNLGVTPGDELVVHSSLSSIGRVDGSGAETVVDALASAVGDEGTVVVPTFTPNLVRREPFDPTRTPSETGAITEALRTRDDAVRSDHPTHSVAALGPAAKVLTADHAFRNSLGEGSPLHRLAARGGKILLLGVGHDSNSTLHVAESLAELPYKTGTNTVLVRGEDDDPQPVKTATVGCGRGFTTFSPIAVDNGLITDGTIGSARSQLMNGDAVLRLARSVLEERPGFLLCEKPECWWCPDAKRTLETA